MARFSIATHENYRNARGEKVTETQWHNLVAWGKVAEIVEKFCKLTRHAMPQSQQEALIQAVLGLEKIADGKELVRLLGTQP